LTVTTALVEVAGLAVANTSGTLALGAFDLSRGVGAIFFSS
jgi:hypothetical protein